MTPTDNGPHRSRARTTSRGGLRLVPALTLAAVAVTAGSVGLWQLQGDGGGVNPEPAANAESGPESGPVESTEAGPELAPETGPELAPELAMSSGERLRVDTDKVAADAADPFLNIRAEAGAGEALVAKLPANYRGLAATGETVVTGDGALWAELELLHPAAIEGSDLDSLETPTGWANADFVVPLSDGVAVGTDEVPACRGDQALTAASNNGEFHVAGLESTMLTDDCLRVVVTMAEGSAAFDWAAQSGEDGAPGKYGVPDIAVVDTPFGARLDFRSTASAWPGALDTADGAYIMRDGDVDQADAVCPRSCLDLVVLRSVDAVSTTVLPELGAVVVDMRLADGQPHDPGSSVHLLQEPLVEGDRVAVEGIARPFEATVGVEIRDENGQPVTADYGGSALGELTGEQYGANTTDWTEAWGRFIFYAEGLSPGDYTMVLNGEGGSDNPRTVEVRFTISG